MRISHHQSRSSSVRSTVKPSSASEVAGSGTETPRRVEQRLRPPPHRCRTHCWADALGRTAARQAAAKPRDASAAPHRHTVRRLRSVRQPPRPRGPPRPLSLQRGFHRAPAAPSDLQPDQPILCFPASQGQSCEGDTVSVGLGAAAHRPDGRRLCTPPCPLFAQTARRGQNII